jgi:hypothetical protein
MDRQARTAAELEAMIMSEMLDLAECRYGMSGIGETCRRQLGGFDAFPQSNRVPRLRRALIAARLREQFDLAG